MMNNVCVGRWRDVYTWDGQRLYECGVEVDPVEAVRALDRARVNAIHADVANCAGFNAALIVALTEQDDLSAKEPLQTAAS